jgi:ATP-dependent exoDNAse (exonuclease V) beta subunit
LPGKKATAAAALDTPARKVQVRWKDGEHLLGVVEAGLRAGKSVLLLYRQARDDPRHLGRLAIMLAAQAKLPTEQRSLRCMTIHGAKGLEAELVVVLGDCTTRAGCAERNQLYALACLGAPGEAAYDRAQADEALRLAYVAITRAAREVHWYLDRSAIERDPYSAAGRTVGAPELFEDLRT